MLADLTSESSPTAPGQSHRSVSQLHQATLFAQDVELSGTGLTATVVRLRQEPGASSPPHRHSGFVASCVVAGVITFQVAGQPEQMYGEGNAFWEPAGAVHQQLHNPSSSEPAIVLAVHVGGVGEPVVLPQG